MNQLAEILNTVFKNKDLFNEENFTQTQDNIFQPKIMVPNSKIDAHYCTNILFLIKQYLKPDYEEKLKSILLANKNIENISFTHGYINFKMKPIFFANILNDILNGDIFPDTGLKNGKKIKTNVEYCSINPTGFLHIGHARNAILGDSIARMLSKANFDVTKEYYVNNAGNQITLLAKSILARYHEMHNQPFEFPEGGYLGNEIKEIALLINQNDNLETIGAIAINFFLQAIKKDLENLNIHHNVWVYETDIIKQGYVEKAIEILKAKDYLYEGMRDIKKAEKGKLEGQPLLLLKTTTFGDDEDRPLTKSDGTWTYLAPDIGYHLNKIERGFEYLICVLGADHDSYANRIKIAVKLLKEDIIHTTPIVQMVSFEHDGKHTKFSKRAGNSIRTHDFIQEIHPDILRYMMLSKTPGMPFIFDYESAVVISMKNPVFYIQYANARAHSIFRNTEIQPKLNMNSFAFQISEFQELIITLSIFKTTLAEAAGQLAPHIIANYAHKLAENLHKLWQMGKADFTKRIIIPENIQETETRLAIMVAFLKILENCLEILGINAPKSMN